MDVAVKDDVVVNVIVDVDVGVDVDVANSHSEAIPLIV